ncbi:cysteine desulfurase [Treponema sp.]
MAGFVGAQFAEEIIFTRGTTEAINLLAHSLGETLQAGDEIILTEMEHHANIVPWQQLAARRGIVLRYIPISDDGELDLDTYQRLLNPRTRLVSFTLSSNVLGSITPAKKIAAMAHNQGALVLMDAAQAAPRTVLDVQDLGADFLALSAHKMYGPFGIGLLYGRRELLEGLPPFMGGGDMIGEVSLEGFTPNELPYKFEAGTPPIAQAVAMAAAADWLESVNLEALGKYEAALAQRLLAALDKIPEIRVLGRAKERSGIVAFTLDGVHAHDLVAYLDRSGFALRAGHHCAHPLARRLGIISSARASFGAYNTIEEVDQLAELLLRAKDDL